MSRSTAVRECKKGFEQRGKLKMTRKADAPESWVRTSDLYLL